MAKTQVFYIDSSAVLEAELFYDYYDTPPNVSSTTWRAVDPNGQPFIAATLPLAPAVNQTFIISASGTMGIFPSPTLYPGVPLILATTPLNPWDIVRWDGTAWNKIGVAINRFDQTKATLTIPPVAFSAIGLYNAIASFTLSSNVVRSTTIDFEVLDPLGRAAATTDPTRLVVKHAWMKLEDLFDSALGGPHLRDRTLANFSPEKMERLVPDALYTINNTYTPATSFDTATYPYTPHAPLLSQALLTQSIRHLMRSYVEQATPVGGGQMGYFDRRDYLNRWQQVLILEEKQLNDWLDLFKRDQMGFGSTSTLVGGYASWYGRYPRYMRGRFPYIFRY